MSEQIAQLQEFQRKVHSSSLHQDAMQITEREHQELLESQSMGIAIATHPIIVGFPAPKTSKKIKAKDKS